MASRDVLQEWNAAKATARCGQRFLIDYVATGTTALIAASGALAALDVIGLKTFLAVYAVNASVVLASRLAAHRAEARRARVYTYTVALNDGDGAEQVPA